MNFGGPPAISSIHAASDSNGWFPNPVSRDMNRGREWETAHSIW